ncbi:MAG: polysaccharide deacetylase family protein [Acidobacteriia bacterium]|nr:polysaccharide deacetylase family protein [Terriglobia bacterium]
MTPGIKVVTTSWDDGDALDLRVGDLLSARGLAGTFYVPIKGHHKRERMTESDLRSLGAPQLEIGAHGISHPDLAHCGPQELVHEVVDCKHSLEDLLGKDVRVFAYPRGRYNGNVIAALKWAGYRGARTTRMLASELAFDPFKMATTVQAYPHPKFAYVRNLVRARYLAEAWKCMSHQNLSEDWSNLARATFDSVLECGGIWHLYGHSWEIEEIGLWDSLQRVLSYVAHREGVLYLTNSEVLGLLVGSSCASP